MNQLERLDDRCDPKRLENYLSGACDPLESETVERHLDACVTCRDVISKRAAEPKFWEAATLNLDSRSDLIPPDEILGQVAGMTSQLESDKPSSHSQSQPSAATTRRYLESWLDPSDAPSAIGRLKHYEVREVVGVGGMGLVMRAFDPSLNRDVAIKTLRQFLTDSEPARKRFAREAQIAAALNHPNVIPIYAVDEWREVPFLVMPFVEQSLNEFATRHPLSLEQTVQVGHQIASGLAAAHSQGMVHRDIKPSNILLLDGLDQVVICDFGLARAMDGEAMTLSGVITGTPQFMSPEQARGEHAGSSSDVFSFGCLMYWLCAGQSPFAAETAVGSLTRILHESHAPLRHHDSDIPGWMESLVDLLLEKNPNARTVDAGEAAQILKSLVGHLECPISRPVPSRLLTEPKAKNWLALRMVQAAAVCVCLVLAWLVSPLFRGSREKIAEVETQATVESDSLSSPFEPVEASGVDELQNSENGTQGFANAVERERLISEFRSGERQEYWLLRLSDFEVDQIPVELVEPIQKLYRGSDRKLSDLADRVLNKNPFVEVDSIEPDSPFVSKD